MSENNTPTLNYQEVELREQDRWLPIANVLRLMKNTLPSTAKVSKDAKECMQECVSEFISFVTSEASDRCVNDKRKTINGEDILYSMYSLGFENYAEVLKIYLAKFREQQALRQERGDTTTRKKAVKKKDQVPVQEAISPENDQLSAPNTTTLPPADAPSVTNEPFISDYIDESEVNNQPIATSEYLAPELDTQKSSQTPPTTANLKQDTFPSLNYPPPTPAEENMLYQYENSF